MIITTKPYEWQEAPFAKAQKKKIILNTLKVGQGKTLCELFVAQKLLNNNYCDTVLILTPLNAYEKRVWKTEVRKHSDQKAISLEELYNLCNGNITHANQILDTHRFVYGKHSHVKQGGLTMLRFIKSLLRARRTFLVIDEVHAYRNFRSELTLRTKPLLSMAVALHGLSATPLSRDFENIYSILDFLKPGILGSFDTFKRVYCTTHEEVIGRTPDGKLKKIEVIDGLRDVDLFQSVISSHVIVGESRLIPKFHALNYIMTPYETAVYRTIAEGISVEAGYNEETWLAQTLKGKDFTEIPDIKMVTDIQAHSSRFIYLQYAADGIINPTGTLGKTDSTKYSVILRKVLEILEKKESMMIYFSFHACLKTFETLLYSTLQGRARVLKSTGQDVLSENSITAETCAKIPHILLVTKAGSESVSYPFMNHVIFANIPTVPDTLTQAVGRITRANTMFPDDLNVYFCRSRNIDDYKMYLVSHKTGMMEAVSGEEGNIPDIFKGIDWKAKSVKKYKNQLLWGI